MQRVQAIAKHKTSYYSFYLPLAMGMSLAGYTDKKVPTTLTLTFTLTVKHEDFF